VISLTKKRTQGSEELSNALVMVIETLLHAVAVHSVPGDPADYGQFQADIRSLREAFVEPSAAGVLAAAGSAEKMIAEYNRRAARFLRMHRAEMQKAVTKLIDVLAAVSSGQESSITRLRDLEQRLAKAPSMEEVTALGVQLSESLEGIRAEVARWRERTEQALSELRRKVESGSNGDPPGGPGQASQTDGGAMTRAKAEIILDQIVQEGGHGYVVAFVVNRVQLINARFGYAVGDNILALFQEHLGKNLKRGDQIFRWSGPVFLATMNRAMIERVRGEVNRLTSAKLETTVHLDNLSVLLPVTCTAAIFSLFETPSAAVLIQQIDAFTAGGTRG
jgi:GGDEF domain-containing protein